MDGVSARTDSLRGLSALLLAAVMLGFTGAAHAVTLSLTPALIEAAPLDIVRLDLVIAGLDAGGPDSLGDFDVDIDFDPTVLGLQTVSFDAFLGDPLLQVTSTSAVGGVIDILELSLEFAATLDAIQPATFRLAEIVFSLDALAPGASTTVTIAPGSVLGDGRGSNLLLDASFDALIRRPAVLAVAEPASALLAALGLGLIGGATLLRIARR